jgi:hypothetical protein
MKRLLSERVIGAALVAMVLAACGTTGQSASSPSPLASPTVVATQGAGFSPSPSSSPAVADVRLVIEDFNVPEVRLARLDATDVATVKGVFGGIAGGQVIVVNGPILEAISRNGTIKKLGRLAADPSWTGPGTVAVKPDLSQWIYTVADAQLTSHIHIGSPSADMVIASVPSPDGYTFYQAFEWNPSGIYMNKQATGLGGAGPFLEYQFPLARFDPTTGHVSEVSPGCIVEKVLDDGTMICRRPIPDGRVEVRSPSGHVNLIRLATQTGNNANDYRNIKISPDGTRLIAARDGATDPAKTTNYQMAVADLTASSAHALGPLDYVPDTWLPDGRVVADHECLPAEWGAGPCDTNLDGTYIFSADGSTHFLFHKLVGGAYVVGYL